MFNVGGFDSSAHFIYQDEVVGDNSKMAPQAGYKNLDAAAIAAQFNKTDPGALTQIARIVERMGDEFVATALASTLHREAEGGLLTEGKQQRRTPGGVFFYLVRGRITAEDRKVLFPRRHD